MPFIEQVNISIGGIPLCLHIPEKELLEKACTRYAEFLSASPKALPIFLQAPDDTTVRTVTADFPAFSYEWNDALLLWGGAEAHFQGVHHEYGLDSLIRILLSVLLVPRRGFLLHAATILRGNHTYVFTGHSGAGKSTVASLSPQGTVLTDEISLLRVAEGHFATGHGDKVQRHEDLSGEEQWHAYGTPFWGEFHAEGANAHAPIKGIYVLVQAPENRVERISAREAIRAMLSNVLFFSRDRNTTHGLLRSLAGVAQQVPCYKLFFRRESSFWEVIE